MRIPIVVLSLSCMSLALFAQSAGGLQWTAPAAWKAEGPRPMRAATYTIVPASGDQAGAECATFFFGAGQGGGVEANIQRWRGQIRGPDGRPASAEIAEQTIGGSRMTTVDTSGTYSGAGGPMAATHRALARYRLLGAVIEGPGGHASSSLRARRTPSRRTNRSSSSCSRRFARRVRHATSI